MGRGKVLRALAVVGALAIVAAACTKKNEGAATPTAAVEKIPVTVYGQGAWTGGANSLTLPSFQGAQIRFDGRS